MNIFIMARDMTKRGLTISLSVLALATIWGCPTSTVNVVDTEIPDEKLIYNQWCAAIYHKDAPLTNIICERFNYSDLEYLPEGTEVNELEDGTVVLVLPTYEVDKGIEHALRHGWIQREEE